MDEKVTLVSVKLVHPLSRIISLFMSFVISVLNVLISSFLPREDVVSFIKSSRDLRKDLHNIPFQSFTLDERGGMNEIKGMMAHLDVIETLEIRGCNFVEHLLLPMKRLRELKLVDCNDIDPSELYSKFKLLSGVTIQHGLIGMRYTREDEYKSFGDNE